MRACICIPASQGRLWLVHSVNAPTPDYILVHSEQTPPGLSSPTFCFTCLIASTFCSALAIMSSTSGIFIATVGLIVALMTFIKIGRLTRSVKLARLSAASAACPCASACSLHMFPMHFLMTFTCSFDFPTSSSSTYSKISCGFKLTTSDAICGLISVFLTNVIGSIAVFPLNFNLQALHLTSGTLAKTSPGSAPFNIVCLFAFTTQNMLCMTFAYSSEMLVAPLLINRSNSRTICCK